MFNKLFRYGLLNRKCFSCRAECNVIYEDWKTIPSMVSQIKNKAALFVPWQHVTLFPYSCGSCLVL